MDMRKGQLIIPIYGKEMEKSFSKTFFAKDMNHFSYLRCVSSFS